MGKVQLGYLANIDDAKRRMKQRQKQKYCTVCERYRWKDEECSDFSKAKTGKTK